MAIQTDQETQDRLEKSELALLALLLVGRRRAATSALRSGSDPHRALYLATQSTLLAGRQQARNIARAALSTQLGVGLTPARGGVLNDVLRVRTIAMSQARDVARRAGLLEGSATRRWLTALKQTEWRASVAAATEPWHAAGLERNAAAREAATAHGLLLEKRWNAERDQATCDICWGMHGQQVAIHEDFDGGLVPGGVHAQCHCWEEIIEIGQRRERPVPIAVNAPPLQVASPVRLVPPVTRPLSKAVPRLRIVKPLPLPGVARATARQDKLRTFEGARERSLPWARSRPSGLSGSLKRFNRDSLARIEALPEAERDALRYFTFTGYEPIKAIQLGITREQFAARFGTAFSYDVAAVHAKHFERAMRALGKASRQESRFTLYRGVHSIERAKLDEILSAKTITLDSVTSSSWEPSAAAEFLGNPEDGYSILFQIKHRSGVSIEGISLSPLEREVIFPKGAQFRVDAVRRVTTKGIRGREKTAIVELTEL
jgi:hypothetical protein